MEITQPMLSPCQFPVRFDDGINGGLNAHLFDKPIQERQVIQPFNTDCEFWHSHAANFTIYRSI
ncbi:MAG: hypothetical protein IPM39_20025 [Chloroflexi bacterium]|nr:hypothetical protein [Chloroflexota bacterium]